MNKIFTIATALVLAASAANAAEKQLSKAEVNAHILMEDMANTSLFLLNRANLLKKGGGCYDATGRDYNFYCTNGHDQTVLTVQKDTVYQVEPVTVGRDGWCADVEPGMEMTTVCTVEGKTYTATTKLTKVRFVTN